MEGRTLGAYRIESELGSGGMGTVYLAAAAEEVHALRKGERVALKVVHPHLLARRGFFKRFLREAEVGKRVRHENVVATLDMDALEIEGRTALFIAMEYVEGRTLRTLLHDLRTVPEALLREIGRQVARGLAAIHDAGIVHRDLKPENVLITDDHQVRIMDLGVARLVEESAAVTKEGEFAGSLLYAAPEQFKQVEVGPAADLYSMGVVLYELATGDNPFRRDDTAQVVTAHLNEAPRPASEVNSEVSPFLSEVVGTLLQKEAGDRFESAEALGELLEEAEASAWWAERAKEIQKVEGHLPRIPVRRETRLYGREEELTTLREAWERTLEGKGSTLFLEGETGIGKSRLAAAFLEELKGRDAHVLYGSYPPSGGMGGLSDAIIGQFGTTGLASALAPYMTVTPTLVPAFAAMVKHETPPTGSEPIQGDALHAVTCHLARSLAAEKPVLWIVDDLHFAPPDSREIVLAVARAIGEHRVLLLGTTEPGLPEDELTHFSRLENFRRMELTRLSPRQVIELLRDAFKSEDLAVKLGGQIGLKSDGVPFFVFEMIRGLKEGQFLKQLPDGTYVQTQVIEQIEVPSAVRDLVGARLKDLTIDERALLDVGSVQGFEFESDLTARVLERKRVEVLQVLAEIERRSGIVRARGRVYGFDHHQIQEVVYADLSDELREEYHALLADAFAAREEVAGKDPGDPSGETCVFLARHHLEGSRPREALPFLEPALTHLGDLYRNDDALALADRALDIAGLLAGNDRMEVLLNKAGRLDLLGRREEERAALDEALALADGTGEPLAKARGRRRLGGHLINVSRYDEAREMLLAAADLAREAGEEKEEARAARGLGAVLSNLGRHEEALEHAERSLALAHDNDDRREEANALLTMGNAFYLLGRFDQAWEHYERCFAGARETGDRRLEASSLWGQGLISSTVGQYEQARDRYERCLGLSREIGYRRGEAGAMGNLGGVFSALGRYEEAVERFECVRSLDRETADPHSEAIADVNLGSVHASLGDFSAAREHLEKCRALSVEIGARRVEGYALHGLAFLADNEGQQEEAVRLYEEALALRREISYAGGVAETLAALGGLLAETDRAEEAHPRLEEALALGRELEAPGIVVVVSCCLALLPSGDPDEALAMFAEHAARLAHAERMQARFLLWRATKDPAHLEEAHRLLEHLVDHAPEECRETMIANVPLHRDIMAAWKRRSG